MKNKNGKGKEKKNDGPVLCTYAKFVEKFPGKVAEYFPPGYRITLKDVTDDVGIPSKDLEIYNKENRTDHPDLRFALEGLYTKYTEYFSSGVLKPAAAVVTDIVKLYVNKKENSIEPSFEEEYDYER